MEIFQRPQEVDINTYDEKQMEFKNNKCYNQLNGLLFSPKCIYFYIFIIFISVMIFIYSFIAHITKLGNLNFILILFERIF